MGTPIGPVVIFRIDAQQVASGTSEAMRQVRDQAKATSQAVAEDWKRMAAQVRATVASGASDDKQVAASRQQLVEILGREISGLRERNELTKQQLSNLKAATLELERQKSVLGGGPGLTSGSTAFAGLISNFLSRTSAQITAGLGGVMGGSQLASGVGALGGIFGGGAAAGAITAVATAAIAATTALGALARSGGEVVKSLELVSQKTGISIKDLQVLEAAGEHVNVGLDDIVIGFRKFSKALVGGSEGGEAGATEASKQMKALLHDLGVTSKEPIEAMKQVADAFAKLPDGYVKADTAAVLFGKSGLTLIPIFNEGRAGIEAYITVVDKYGAKIGPDLINKTHAWETANTTLSESYKKLKTDIADENLPAMTRMVDFIAEKVIPVVDRWAKAQSEALKIAPETGGFKFTGGGLIGKIFGNLSDWESSVGHFGGLVANSGKDMDLAGRVAKDLATNIDRVGTAAGGTEKTVKQLTAAIKEMAQAETLRGHTNLFKEGPLYSLGRTTAIAVAAQQAAPEIPLGAPNVPDVLGPVIGAGPAAAAKAFDVMKTINQEHEDLFTTQRDKDLAHYAQESKDLLDAYNQKLISQEQYNDAALKIQQDQNKTLEDLAKEQTKKIEELSGKLFDDLMSGHVKGLGKRLSEDLLKIFDEPLKKQFEAQFAKLLAPLLNIFQPKTAGGASTAGSAPGGGPGIFGTIFGGIPGLGSTNAPGGTPGWWPGSIGIGGSPGTGIGTGTRAGAGQVGVATQTMYVTANVVNISGVLGLPGTGPLGSTTGNFFGNLNPFGSASLPGGIGIPGLGAGGIGGIGGAGGSSGIGGVLGNLGPFIGAGAMLGAGIASNSPTAMALGLSTMAGAGIKSLLSSGVISSTSGLGQALSTIAPGLPGVGLFAAGTAQGGVGGTAEATLGGAEAGMAYGGPIGAAIGAGVGLISGIVSSMIQGPSFQQKVAHNMAYQAYRLPPSETFSFAEGSSIGQTLSTGAVQSGSTFSAFGLPANTPFWANPVTGRLDVNQERNYLLEQMGLSNNQPFEGLPTVNPFTGQDPVKINRNTQPATSVTFNIHAIDAGGVADFLNIHGEAITRAVTGRFWSSSSGWGSRVRMAAFPP